MALKEGRCCFFFQAEDGIRDHCVTGVQTCALPILHLASTLSAAPAGTQRGSKMFGNFLGNAAGYGIETYLGIALIVVAEIDAAVVRSPLGVLDIAIEYVRQGMRIGAIADHQVELGGLMALVAVIVAGVGDEFSVGRHSGRIVRPFAVAEM